jgi:hypothetical protein
MSFRFVIGASLAAILAVALVLGAIHFTGSQTSAQEWEVPPDVYACLVQEADLNGDGEFDALDILIFKDAFGCEDPEPCYNSICDKDGDGDVDVFDIVAFAVAVRDCLPIP